MDTEDTVGGDSTSKHLRQIDRREKALKEAFDRLETDYPEDRNSVLADNQLLDELGVFSDEYVDYFADRSRPVFDFQNIPGREWSPERERTMQVQTRMNAMNAHLNTRSILAELRKTSLQFEELKSKLKWLGAMLTIVLVLVIALASTILWTPD